MEFAEVVRKRRMVRTFTGATVPRVTLERVLEAGLRAPSAGHTQGTTFRVLESAADRAAFWDAVAPDPTPGGRWDRLRTAPVIVIPTSDKQAYLDRYAEPDKAGLGMHTEDGWPAPYWDIDAAFAVMAMLLAATDAGLGALFFAAAAYDTIGALALGWPAPDPPSPSLRRPRRTDRVVWGGA